MKWPRGWPTISHIGKFQFQQHSPWSTLRTSLLCLLLCLYHWMNWYKCDDTTRCISFVRWVKIGTSGRSKRYRIKADYNIEATWIMVVFPCRGRWGVGQIQDVIGTRRNGRKSTGSQSATEWTAGCETSWDTDVRNDDTRDLMGANDEFCLLAQLSQSNRHVQPHRVVCTFPGIV